MRGDADVQHHVVPDSRQSRERLRHAGKLGSGGFGKVAKVLLVKGLKEAMACFVGGGEAGKQAKHRTELGFGKAVDLSFDASLEGAGDRA